MRVLVYFVGILIVAWAIVFAYTSGMDRGKAICREADQEQVWVRGCD